MDLLADYGSDSDCAESEEVGQVAESDSILSVAEERVESVTIPDDASLGRPIAEISQEIDRVAECTANLSVADEREDTDELLGEDNIITVSEEMGQIAANLCTTKEREESIKIPADDSLERPFTVSEEIEEVTECTANLSIAKERENSIETPAENSLEPVAVVQENDNILQGEECSSKSLLRQDELRREKEDVALVLSSFFDDGKVVPCFSNEYGEYGRLKIICAHSASLLGLQVDQESAIVIGRKVSYLFF